MTPKFPTVHMSGLHVEYLGSNSDLDFYLWHGNSHISPTIQYGPLECEYASRGLTIEEYEKKMHKYRRQFFMQSADDERLCKLLLIIECLTCSILNTIKQ